MHNNAKRCWKQYNKSLVQRGSITFWIDKDFLKNSDVFESSKGRPKFKNALILSGWAQKIAYKLTFRTLEGFFNSLLNLIGSKISSPHYSLFCKRSKEVSSLLPKLSSRRSMEIVIDASGLKIFGEGEWKTYKHGREKRRRWLKVHAAVDPKTGECVVVKITDEKGADSAQLRDLLSNCPRGIKRAYADGAYDTKTCRGLLRNQGIEDIIPPRKTSVLREEKEMRNRNDALREIKELGGDYELWKKLKGYGRRSLAETFFSRLKMTLGDRLSCRKEENQILESLLKIQALNRMAKATYQR